ncbi:MAG: hypothetical protein NTU80_12240 [Verrucomicrobia bacterium]|nr:hypothetical protein [Verrucomicrobiota bacterium]
MPASPRFARYLGLDYSGAETPTSSLKGLRLYSATPDTDPVEIPPPPGPKKYWTRRGVAEWLAATLRDGPPTLLGIDHAFSFPMRYFEVHHLAPDWQTFLEDFCQHWPTHEDHLYVDFVRGGLTGNAAARSGETRWRRLTELRSRAAKSVFHFDVQGSVAKSTHAGLPWLRYLRREVGPRLHCWPFDGWTPPAGASVAAEIYPRLWSAAYPTEGRTPDQHDAYAVAHWLRDNDRDATLLDKAFAPQLTPSERTLAQIEGWILGLA